MQKVVSLVAGVGTMALLAAPGASAMTSTAPALPLTPAPVDPAIVRAAVASNATATAPVSKVLGSGEGGVKCLVKFFEPDLLKTKDFHKWEYWDKETILFLQTKLICTDTVGVSEILIEQNDQLVVAGTITNNQTNVTLHNLTVKLNEEQQDTFCVAVARQSGSTYQVIAQECWNGLGDFHHGYGGGYGGYEGGKSGNNGKGGK